MTSKEQMKERRDWLRENGICIQCGQKDAVKGYVRCGDCLYKQGKYKDQYKKKHGKINQSEQVKARKVKLRKQGVCIQCGKRKIYRGGLCNECWIKAKTYHDSHYVKTGARDMWAKNNLCRVCGSDVVDGYKVCHRCLDNIRKAREAAPINNYWVDDNKLVFLKKGN